MRIDLPCCDMKTCVHCQDHNCTNKQLYATCNYAKSNRVLEEVSAFLTQFEIDCPEDIHQRDSVLEELPEFTSRLVNIMMESYGPPIKTTFNDRVNQMTPEEKAGWLFEHDRKTAKNGRLTKEELLSFLLTLRED